MKIITIPHLILREKAQAVTQVDEQLIRFIEKLKKTLGETQNPRGVGLAAPQVNSLLRIFATNLPVHGSDRSNQEGLRHFINPVIVKACKRKKVLGVDPRDPDLEGCLSMPGLYGPVPRHRWIELKYQTLGNGQLQSHKKRFDDFQARVIQHELDHLNGILFTDYSLEQDLPVYHQSNDDKKMVEIDQELIKAI